MKDIKGYERVYAVTRNGEVWSYRNNKFLKALKHSNGYLQVDLHKDGKRKTYLIHRLVAQTYIPNPENKGDVNHIDGNKENNNINNLEWATRSENVKHAFDNGLNYISEKQREAVSKVGKQYAKQNNIKYKSKQVEVIFPNGSIKTYYSAREASRKLGLPESTVKNCINYHNGYYKKQNLRFRYIEKEK